MNNKTNIFEELNKMRMLIKSKSGTIISEQANPSADAGTIMREIGKFNSNEAEIVKVLKNYKDKASFKGFLDQYKTISGKDFGTDLIRAVSPTNDKTEWNDLTNHLSTLGVALKQQIRDPRKGGSFAIFGGIESPNAAVVNTEELWKNSKVSCVTTQPGAKKVTLKNGSIGYIIGTTRYYANGRKQLLGQPMTNYTCATEFKSKLGGDVNSRFSKSAESLGIKGGKMDLQTLQTMLKALEGGVESSSSMTVAQGAPDIAQLTAALKQLKA